ncbi:DUF2163 domain-containing protein [Sphingosinicella soli]|uniref:Putative phage protein (TIGR02218 family) n=1 Tax=Sphingosinicella soli TaxID=333708 RepID=A0A7W7B495_9SPHN|nr:DUF2163 domain-containing protein [Sphingosinicella soli]MBB4633659.1 putative phage protein (TIGR02218 family) [Sphingosinicella soli]
MRDIPEALAAALEQETTSLAFCWRIERADGAALGFTSHDRALTVDGMICSPVPGMVPSALAHADSVEGGGMDVTGALGSGRIRADEIGAGRYDRAAAALFLVDWRAPEAAVLLASGEIGDIVRREDRFEAELKSAHADLDRSPIALCTPECRARLGDPRCGVALAPLTHVARVTAATGAHIETDRILPDGALAYGRLRPLAGPHAGLDFEIVASAGGAFDLREAVAGLMAGDPVELREGCDRRFSTCRDRFLNTDNFRGEPHVPGTDSVIRYPSL